MTTHQAVLSCIKHKCYKNTIQEICTETKSIASKFTIFVFSSKHGLNINNDDYDYEVYHHHHHHMHIPRPAEGHNIRVGEITK